MSRLLILAAVFGQTGLSDRKVGYGHLFMFGAWNCGTHVWNGQSDDFLSLSTFRGAVIHIRLGRVPAASTM